MSQESDTGSPSSRPTLIDRLRGLFGLSEPSIRDDIEVALEDNSGSGDFSPQERSMLKNVLGLHELRVEDVMVPRADIIAVSMDSSLAEVLATFRTAGHSRLPVHGETLDDPRGMVHIRDFVDHIARAAEAAMGRGRRKVPQGPPTAGAASTSHCRSRKRRSFAPCCLCHPRCPRLTFW